MTAPFSMLPMYDWPETQASVNRLWTAIREALIGEGVGAPTDLRRPDDLYAAWANEALLIGQTCGMPLVQTLATVEVVGTFDHRLPATPPGWYHSVIVVAADRDVSEISELRGTTVAVNGADSQSGHAVWRHELGWRGLTGSFFGDVVLSGGHRHSIEAVANGLADVAAIDAVSMLLAERHEPAAAGVRILTRSHPTPGLPLITANVNAGLVTAIRRALHTAVESLTDTERETQCIYGFVPLDRRDYDLITERWRRADAVPALA